MLKAISRTSVRSPCRMPFERRRGRPRCGFVPTLKGGGLVPFGSLLGADLLGHMAADPYVASIRALPEAFVWRDGADGRRRGYTPDLLAVMTDGSKVYRSARPHSLLLRDPELSGKRARIELECSARGAAFEIWTEREIREETCGWPLMRVATPAETMLVADLPPRSGGREAEGTVPGLVLRIADRLSLWRPRQVGNAYFARSMLTGIMMALLCELVRDPVTGLLVWKPAPRKRGPSR